MTRLAKSPHAAKRRAADAPHRCYISRDLEFRVTTTGLVASDGAAIKTGIITLQTSTTSQPRYDVFGAQLEDLRFFVPFEVINLCEGLFRFENKAVEERRIILRLFDQAVQCFALHRHCYVPPARVLLSNGN